MIKKIAALLATVVIIGSAASVSATRTLTGSGEWWYGANIVEGTYSNYIDWSYSWWSASVWTPWGEPYVKSGKVYSGHAVAKKMFYLWDNSNKAYYNRGS